MNATVHKIAAALGVIMLLTGCNIENNENSRAEAYTTQSETESKTSSPPQTTTAATSVSTSLSASDVIPQALQTPRVDGNRLSYSIVNIFSEGEYYTVEISGVKYEYSDSTDIDTTYVNGDLYGDFRLDLMKKGEILDTLKINVPRDDRFLILESVSENLSYGCELVSNKREFNTDSFPDIIQLDFYMQNEVEAPQYARYFSVFGGKIAELPVYEEGEEAAPYGTHLEMKSEGLMIQHITASEYDGSYTIKKYEYTFDTENRCLDRKQVKFYGWEN